MNFLSTYLSHWAAANRKTARWLIVFLSLFSAILFFEFGLYLPEMNLFGSIFLWSSAVLLMAYAWITHKQGKRPLKRTMIYFCLSLLWLHLGNQSVKILSISESNNIETASVLPVKPIAKAEKGIRKFLSKHFTKRKTQLKNNLGNIEQLSPIAAFFIFSLFGILALVIALILTFVSCSLSCSGQVAMSYVLLVSAAIFLLGGLFLFGYAIYRAGKKPNKKASDF